MTPRKKRMSRTAIILTQRSLNDLHDIESYSVSQFGRKAADRYLYGIETALERLRETPAILKMESAFLPGLWFYRVQKHVLVCDMENEQIIVLTILHTSMDLPARLQDLEPRLLAEVAWLRGKLRS